MKKSAICRITAPFSLSVLVISVSFGISSCVSCPDGQRRAAGICVADEQTPSYVCEPQQHISSGEKRLFSGQSNLDLDKGTEAFANGNYGEAIAFFEKAIDSAPNSPEPQIYLNNAIARQKAENGEASIKVIAVAAPIENRVDPASEMLRGVADAQTKLLNQSTSEPGYLVEVVIINDSNNPDLAACVAEEISNRPEILGVVGHNSSDVSKAALAVYEEEEVVMISPTSTSTTLVGESFFRTVSSDAVSGKFLAQYLEEQGVRQAAVFFSSDSAYSNSLKDSFDANFGGVISLVDFADDSLFETESLKSQFDEFVFSGVQVALLFPSTNAASRAITVAKVNYEIPSSERLQLIGGDSLYAPETLRQGANTVNGMLVLAPWFPSGQQYAEDAYTRWKGRVSWRTAMSFDAASALIEVLSVANSRKEVKEALRTMALTDPDTSGNPLKFVSGKGEREGASPVLVEVQLGGNRPQGTDVGFELLNSESGGTSDESD